MLPLSATESHQDVDVCKSLIESQQSSVVSLLQEFGDVLSYKCGGT